MERGCFTVELGDVVEHESAIVVFGDEPVVLLALQPVLPHGGDLDAVTFDGRKQVSPFRKRFTLRHSPFAPVNGLGLLPGDFYRLGEPREILFVIRVAVQGHEREFLRIVPAQNRPELLRQIRLEGSAVCIVPCRLARKTVAGGN